MKITYEFDPYEDRDDLLICQKSQAFWDALWEIHNICRAVWKREDNASEDRVSLAEEIQDIISKSGVHDIS